MLKWPADRLERRLTDALVPYATNSRTHSEEQVTQIAQSLREWGWTNPVLIDENNTIIAGHGRVLAAKKLAIAEVPVIVAENWSEAQKRAYVIADNQLAMNAGWDLEMLKSELKAIDGMEFDLDLLGFDNLQDLLAETTVGLTDPDDVPETPAVPVSQLGDVWLLGRHRIICGDCTDAEVVSKVLAGVKPHLMVTDPPYGVNYDASWRGRAGVGSVGAATGKVLNDNRADWREAWALFPGAVAYVWHAGTFAGDVAASLASCKFKVRAQIVWVKSRHVLSRGHYHHQHEPCFYGVRDGESEQWSFVPEHEVAVYSVKDGKTGEWNGGRKQSTVWFIEHIKSDTGHSTQKPVECMKRPIENNSSPGHAVYEPFSGSGTTIIAGEITGRSVHAIELNPPYVDVAVKRWQEFTGKPAILEGAGLSFDEVAKQRGAI